MTTLESPIDTGVRGDVARQLTKLFNQRTLGQISDMRRLQPRLWIMACLCVPLVAACAAAPVTPADSPPAPPALGTAQPGKEVPTASTLDAAMAAAAVDQAGVARSGAIWVIRGSALSISTDLGSTWTGGTIPLPEPDMINPATFVLDAEHAWSLTVPPGSGDGDHGQGPTFDHVHLLVNRTSDGGKSWKQAPVPGDHPDSARNLFFVDSKTGYLMISGGRASPGDEHAPAQRRRRRDLDGRPDRAGE